MIQLDKLIEDIKKYCDYNQITDVESFLVKCLTKGFNIEKYGISPTDNFNREHGKISAGDEIKIEPDIKEPVLVVAGEVKNQSEEKETTPKEKKKTVRKRTIKEKKQ